MRWIGGVSSWVVIFGFELGFDLKNHDPYSARELSLVKTMVRTRPLILVGLSFFSGGSGYMA